ncbi:glycosyltransferase, partial [Actinoplanes sp. NPDC051633]|uniref:glycosyltransferase n=1 Tax=Actinoplanes sp. NPDC051633 TaxID=3155670 RepID=UPI00341E8BA2
MRILFISGNYHPVIGGAETYAKELARGMVRAGHEVCIVTPGDHSTVAGDHITTEAGVQVIRLGAFMRALLTGEKAPWEQLYFDILDAIHAHADLSRFDVIHANSHETAIIGSMLKLEGGIPLVVTSHEMGREKT